MGFNSGSHLGIYPGKIGRAQSVEGVYQSDKARVMGYSDRAAFVGYRASGICAKALLRQTSRPIQPRTVWSCDTSGSCAKALLRQKSRSLQFRLTADVRASVPTRTAFRWNIPVEHREPTESVQMGLPKDSRRTRVSRAKWGSIP